MTILKRVNSSKILVVMATLTLLSACGGGGGSGSGGPGGSPAESNPDFIAKAEAISFTQIRLYDGHINPADPAPVELDVNTLESGDLITVDVEFEITGSVSEYSLLVQLVPQSVFDQLRTGNTVGEIFPADSLQVADFIDLGGAYLDTPQPGIFHGVIHAKLPVLEQDTIYKVLVTPSLEYLSASTPISNDDILVMPALLDNRQLLVGQLGQVSVKIAEVPNLSIDNEFTQLEIGSKFDVNGFSIEPIFQTSIEVDLTSFAIAENIILSLSWTSSGGGTFPLGLLTSDVDGNPVISTDPQFKINSTDATSVTIPVVAYSTNKAQSALLRESTDIRDIADQAVQTGNFNLSVFYIENGLPVDTGQQHTFSIPLVSQDNSPLVLSDEAAVNFTVLRAGLTNDACVVIRNTAFNIDTGELITDVEGELIATPCPAAGTVVPDEMLWRYDLTTKQFISKEKDLNNNNYCIAWADQPPSSNFFPLDFNLRKCAFETSAPGTAIISQRFIFDGQKIRLEEIPAYLEVIITTSFTKEVTAVFYQDLNFIPTTADFFTNTNGVEIDQFGRIFYVGKFYDRGWGNADTARVDLSFGGESYVDYYPVIGATTEGHATLSTSLLGINANLIDTNFGIKRYFSKKISVLGINTPDVEAGDGAQLTIDIAGFTAFKAGSITRKTITDSYLLSDPVGDVLFGVPKITDREAAPIQFKVNEDFVNTTVLVSVIPVTIKGGVDGTADVKIKLTSPEVGFQVAVTEAFKLSGFLSAQVLAAGVEGKLTVIDQSLTFAAGGGFGVDTTFPSKLTFEINSSLIAKMKLLKGELTAFVEYPSLCCFPPKVKTRKKEKVLYSSDFLFNQDWEIYSKNITATIIDY
ncbi:MAG: hypothetical protein OEY09_08550 [Gammaproteobacteria bacterium]|nr:hypothetical protein [Gammaproteobacteria bacterium]